MIVLALLTNDMRLFDGEIISLKLYETIRIFKVSMANNGFHTKLTRICSASTGQCYWR